MKIGLWAQHAGLIELLTTLWEDHDVRLAPRWDKYPKTWQGDEDVIVSTLPYGVESMHTGKPTIVYYTDPTFPDIQREVQSFYDGGKVHVVGAENCYPSDLFINGVRRFIPFSCKPSNYPPYTGWKPIVAVVNRKPHERWGEVIRGATGVDIPLGEFLADIPYEIVNEWDTTRFRLHYAENRVMFYYSNSPYTIVMFEAMTVGMPIVAFNHHHRWDYYRPIEKYLWHYSTDREYVRGKLREHLERKPERVGYPLLPKFGEVKQRWQEEFDYVTHRYY